MPSEAKSFRSSNRLGLDYVAEAQKLREWPFTLVDVHAHLHGSQAARVYAQVADAYGVGVVFSMTPMEELHEVKKVLSDRVRFIAIPDFFAEDRIYALSKGYAERLRQFADCGVRIAKFWSAPRGVDFAEQSGAPGNSFRLDAPHVAANMELAVELGMSIMVHVGDPDTWFATHYSNANRYGTKKDQYVSFVDSVKKYPDVLFIAAHMGGWPENLDFLDDLLQDHPNLVLDTSATKWMVRELSIIEPSRVRGFFERWRGRLLFGSDVVTRDGHLHSRHGDTEDQKANSEAEAFELYASRYWALRTLFETDYHGASPIADPDLHLVEPDRFGPDDAPEMRGFSLSPEILQSVYHDNAKRLLLDAS